jgi:hypothetical protein
MIVQSSLHINFMFQILRLWQKIKQPLHDVYGKIQQFNIINSQKISSIQSK